MARIRPARTTRYIHSQAWARYSQKLPKKNYIRARPHTSLLTFNMGADRDDYDLTASLDALHYIQLRSNAIEAARESTNKYLESQLPGEYYFRVLVFPHSVIREHRLAVGAHADRISQGMSLSFGKPMAMAARLRKGQALFMVRASQQNVNQVKEALKRATSKLSGHYRINVAKSA